MQIATFNGRRLRKSRQSVGVTSDNQAEEVQFILPECERPLVILKLKGFGAYNETLLEARDGGWFWTVRREHIGQGTAGYGQIEMLSGDDRVWQSYVFPIRIESTLLPEDDCDHEHWAYLREIERMLQQKASMEDLEAYIAMHGGVQLIYGDTVEQFPEQGVENALYLDKANTALYYWSGDEGCYKRLSADSQGDVTLIYGGDSDITDDPGAGILDTLILFGGGSEDGE